MGTIDEKPRTKVIDVKALVEKLDPKRHEDKVTYEFSNGRKFKGKVKYV